MKELAYYAHWFLRLAIAAVFLYHGIGKFPRLAEFAKMMNLPFVIALLVALMEVFGAIFILTGAFLKSSVTRLGAVILIPIMLVAIFKAHWGQWSFLPSENHPMGGIEFQVVLLAILLYLLLKGNRA